MKIFLYLAAVALCSAQDFGHIENLQVTSGDGSITLEWDFVAGDPTYKLHKYTILTDNDFSTDLRCPAAHCTTIIDYLDACKEHTFDVTPVFDDTVNGGSVNGDTSSISGFTNDLPPSSPSNLRVLSEDDSGTTLQWDAPTKNPICVQSYKVCYRLDKDPTPTCETTEDTTITLAGLQACGKYHVTVTPVTPSDTEGPQLEQDVTTEDGLPGPPQDVKVGITTDSLIEMEWNNPAINPLCVQDYSITYGEVESRRRFSSHQVEDFGDDYDHHANIGPLEPCTEYIINITSISKNGLKSESVSSEAATIDTDPQPPPYVVLDSPDSDTIDVEWGVNEGDRCAGYYIVCWTDDITKVEVCQNVTDGGSLTISDLLACALYNVSVTVVTPSGIPSNTVTNHTYTKELAPGPVQNVQVIEAHLSSLTVSYEVPVTNPQCVGAYDTRVINLDKLDNSAKKVTEGVVKTNTIAGLEPCTNYEIEIAAVSHSGEYMSVWKKVDGKTKDGTPSEPQNISVKDATIDSLTLQWFEPITNSPCVIQYDLTWTDGINTGSAKISDVTSNKFEYTIEGLNSCDEYTITLSAKSTTSESRTKKIIQKTDCP
ncbi:collagen alpha-1(XIV) chain-like [Homarus americanus]|uniref:Receptor-type tyrosine-protein phosphatase F-like 3 n=1 Tax=Homarus americanus TaxID=6706 RepID=A0A8J5JRN7_HOMAM|nr:collagen alpha-1(XIV) chain-like [Homarus americanus]KAG7160510.1 Receptor-type tyrosine-protein phosphatase F-like 3 [Homarus americanus]